MNYLILTMVFVSGFSIMTIELLGGRILAPYFGGSIYVWGSIITVFMLALSIGYLLGGRWSLHNANLRRYGSLFGLSAVAILPLLIWGNDIMEAIFLRFTDPRYGSLIASMALFFVPTVIMGMIAPYSVRLLVQSRQSSGMTAGFLYFVSTLGSAAGTLATSFYLVLYFEMNHILIALMGALLSAGIGAALLSITGKLQFND